MSLSAPSVRTPEKSLASALEPRRNFLSEVVIDYGPRDMLGRLFLKADNELRQRGIELSFAPPEALVELNRLADIRIEHVPYRGGVPSLTGAIAGEVQDRKSTRLNSSHRT